jgi:putative sigma-54 modulation protein
VEVTVRGRNVEITDRLRAAAQEKVGRLSRHHEGWEQAEIHFFEERNPRISAKEVCEATLRGHGRIIRAKAASADPLASLDRVVDKLEHQIEKLKSRLMSRTHPKRHQVDSDRSGDDGDDGDGDDGGGDDDGSGRGGQGPVRIVKTKRFDIKPMTPEEAALQMDVLGHDFYLFTNADTGVAAVVYRRNDGDVGLIDAS